MFFFSLPGYLTALWAFCRSHIRGRSLTCVLVWIFFWLYTFLRLYERTKSANWSVGGESEIIIKARKSLWKTTNCCNKMVLSFKWTHFVCVANAGFSVDVFHLLSLSRNTRGGLPPRFLWSATLFTHCLLCTIFSLLCVSSVGVFSVFFFMIVDGINSTRSSKIYSTVRLRTWAVYHMVYECVCVCVCVRSMLYAQ